MRFDWTDLQLFVHACDAGSLTGAAQRAHLTLAAVSARIRAMESGSGATLLQRHSRGVRPTAAGEALARHARAVLDQMAQLRAELAQHAGLDRGPLRLLANTSAMAQRIAGPLATFLLQHPASTVTVEESASHLSVQALRQGLADAAIVSDAADVAGLDARVLGDDPLVLILPAGHPLAAVGQPPFAQALDFPWIGFGSASALQTHLALQAARLDKPMQLRAQAGHIGAVVALVAQGVGLTVLPAALVPQQGAQGQAGALAPRLRGDDAGLVVKPLAEPWARRKLLLCSYGPAARRPAVQALLACFA